MSICQPKYFLSQNTAKSWTLLLCTSLIASDDLLKFSVVEDLLMILLKLLRIQVNVKFKLILRRCVCEVFFLTRFLPLLNQNYLIQETSLLCVLLTRSLDRFEFMDINCIRFYYTSLETLGCNVSYISSKLRSEFLFEQTNVLRCLTLLLKFPSLFFGISQKLTGICENQGSSFNILNQNIHRKKSSNVTNKIITLQLEEVYRSKLKINFIDESINSFFINLSLSMELTSFYQLNSCVKEYSDHDLLDLVYQSFNFINHNLSKCILLNKLKYSILIKNKVFEPIIMNSLHKKRQAFRQVIRSKSIQQLFHRKRQQLLQQLKKTNQKEYQPIQSEESSSQIQIYQQKELTECIEQGNYKGLKLSLANYQLHLSRNGQQRVFLTIIKHRSLFCLQKIDLLCKLINRREFCLNNEIQNQYGWKRLIQELLSFILQKYENIQEKYSYQIASMQNIFFSKKYSENKQISNQSQMAEIKKLLNMACFSLIKIWHSKPKYEYFLMFPKAYHLIYEKISTSLALSLIAQLSYEKALLPNYQFISKVFEITLDQSHEVKLFRILEILKNFICNFKVTNNQIHPRQLIFSFVNWIKIQVNFLLQNVQPNQNGIIMEEQISAETKYCLIYLLFTTLNKLFEVNEHQKERLSTKEILIMNEELLNHRQNHTTMKFLIHEGKQSVDEHHKKNIFRTLNFFISFLEVSTFGQQKEESVFETQIQEIQKTFQGTELDWFQSFN